MTDQAKNLVILDRDGVINIDSADYIKSPGEWIPIPGSLEAICRFAERNWLIFIVTNQSGIARDLFSESTLRQIHQKMCNLITQRGGYITGIYFCPHHPRDGCSCRKPNTGLLQQIEIEHQLSVKGAPFIGDSLKDVKAALSAGCKPVVVKTGNGKETVNQLANCQSIQVCENLADASELLLNQQSGS